VTSLISIVIVLRFIHTLIYIRILIVIAKYFLNLEPSVILMCKFRDEL